jgi:hypothetical protein
MKTDGIRDSKEDNSDSLEEIFRSFGGNDRRFNREFEPRQEFRRNQDFSESNFRGNQGRFHQSERGFHHQGERSNFNQGNGNRFQQEDRQEMFSRAPRAEEHTSQFDRSGDRTVRFSESTKSPLNTSVVFNEPTGVEYYRPSQDGQDQLELLTTRMVNSGLLSRQEAAQAHLQGAVVKQSLSRREFQDRPVQRLNVETSVDKLLEDFDFRPNGRNIDEILGDKFARVRFGSEVEKIQIKMKLLEFIASHPSCSSETKMICLDELGRSPISRFHKDQLDSSLVLPRPYLNTIMPGKNNSGFVEVPILGRVSSISPHALKFLTTAWLETNYPLIQDQMQGQ